MASQDELLSSSGGFHKIRGAWLEDPIFRVPPILGNYHFSRGECLLRFLCQVF